MILYEWQKLIQDTTQRYDATPDEVRLALKWGTQALTELAAASRSNVLVEKILEDKVADVDYYPLDSRVHQIKSIYDVEDGVQAPIAYTNISHFQQTNVDDDRFVAPGAMGMEAFVYWPERAGFKLRPIPWSSYANGLMIYAYVYPRIPAEPETDIVDIPRMAEQWVTVRSSLSLPGRMVDAGLKRGLFEELQVLTQELKRWMVRNASDISPEGLSSGELI